MGRRRRFRQPRGVRGGEGDGRRRARRERGAEGADCGAGIQAHRQGESGAQGQAGSLNLTDEPEADERDDGAPIEVLEQYFEARGWACERTGEGEIVASASGSWAQYELRGVWRNEDQVLQFLAFPDIKVAAEKRAAIYEALGLINEQLWLGHFEMWSGSGLIVFRHAAMVGEGDSLSFEQAEAIAEAALEECERFYPVFQFVLWGGKSPGEAISAALIETVGEA